MIAVNCYVCDVELEEPGALYFTRPAKNGQCQKRHLCKTCSAELESLMRRVKDSYQSGELRREEVPPATTAPPETPRPLDGE